MNIAMQEMTMQEVNEVAGGLAFVVFLAVSVGAAACWEAYASYTLNQ